MHASAHRERLTRFNIDDVVVDAARIERVRKASEPAIWVAAVGRPGLPVSHRGKMREAWVVVADPMDDRELTVLEQALESGHARLNPKLVVQPAQFFRPNAELWARAIIGIVRIRDDGVQAIVRAR